ncbi:TonB-dependent receptor domain-containing protein [Pedobacter sp. L105]|uniref:TonB-dependent receptor domain-containing protein n=1 Tax=Pedobacter sp. L105 TaxID=1641871 RepID=UPI0020B14F62|nr:TonB-dependent receptor [Pedobacter sp. L105]
MPQSKFKSNFLILVLCFFFAKTNLHAQDKIFLVKGLVLDNKQQPVPGASVTILSSPTEQIISKTITNEKGGYQFESGGGSIEILVSYVGYGLNRTKPLLISRNTVIDPVILQDDNKLKEVVIKGESTPPLIQASGGKIVFNVANSVSSQGSNALEVLKKAPGVTVNPDNTINIAGRQGALVMLNGKQTYLQPAELSDLLKSISSSNVKTIEVINNPSAQYDAAGSGGIINIVLKKNENEGLNGTFDTGVSYGYSLKNNTALSFNYRKDKINVFGNYSQTVGSHGFRYGIDRDEDGQSYRGWSHDTDQRKTISSSVGMDYNIAHHQTIGVQFNGNFLFGPGDINTRTTISDLATGTLENTLLSESNYYHQSSNRYNSNLNYRYEDTLGNVLTVDADYGKFNGGQGILQPNTYLLPDGTVSSANNTRTVNNRDINLYALFANYARHLWAGKFSAGLKYSSITAANLFDLYAIDNNEELLNTQSSNNFDFKEQIFSSFVQYEHPLTDKLSFQGGMRLEETTATGLLSTIQAGQQEGNIKRNYWNGFPSIGLVMKVKEGETLSLNYGKRIDRPAYQDLNPIEQPFDGLTTIKGNPYLLPQLTNRVSLQFSFKKTIIDLSVSRTSNYFAYVTDTLGGNKVVMQTRNLGVQKQAGLNIIQQIRPLKIWNISANAVVYYMHNQIALDETRIFSLGRLAASLNIQQTIQLPLGMKGEVGAVFNTNRLGGSNDISRRNSQVDLALQKSLLKNKAKVSLAITDIYQGNKWDSTNYYSNYFIRSYGHAETRQVKLNFSYNFGNTKVKAPKENESGLKSETNRL